MGKEVKYDLFGMGVYEQIARNTNGLDPVSKELIERLLRVAHALRSVGGYDFEDKLENRMKFVRAMKRPVFDLFYEEYRSALLQLQEMVEAKTDELKKSTPDQA